MYKLLNFSPVPNDGTSVYRSWGALPRIENIECIKAAGSIDWTSIMGVDGIFLQRAFTPEQVQIAHLAKQYKKPVWSEWDDDLFCVPKDNPTNGVYSQAGAKQNVESCARMSNLITVTTEALKAKWMAFNEHVHVVPNAIDFDLITPMATDIPRNPLIVWRGSHTHVRDIQEHTEAILWAHEQFPQLSWCFFGYDPWWITEKMDPKRVRCVPFDASYPGYMGNLMKMRGAIQIVPLHDSEFNRAKSNISYLEGTVAGSVVLTPDWDEWKNTGAIHYNGKDGFKSKLMELCGTPAEELAKIANTNLEWVKKYRNLDLMNKERSRLMSRYMGT